jgi:hypothetical protein
MLVFIDESGCSGFKLARGSDAVFAIGMVVFENRECALRTDRCIASFRERRGYVREFKFSKSGNRLRDEFFETVRGCPFRVRALIVEKANVQDAVLRSDDGAFYDYFMGRLVQRAAPTLRRAPGVPKDRSPANARLLMRPHSYSWHLHERHSVPGARVGNEGDLWWRSLPT